jgi:1-acyl-sn-glycerol-3-phosphate acyltransferase
LSKRWSLIKTSISWLAKLAATPIKIHGLQNLPPENRACIYVANHASYLDGPVIINALPRIVRFVAKSELKQRWLSQWFLNHIEAEYIERFDVEKSLEDLNRLCDSARKNHGLFFFPEGTFERRQGLLPFHLGAFFIAAKANLPVVPITIRGTRSILRANTWLPSQGAIQVFVGEAITPEKIRPEKTVAGSEGDLWALAKQLRDAARTQIIKTTGEPDLISESITQHKS